MAGRLAGRVAIVTGATSGIGRATALRFAAEGADLALTGRDASALAGIAEEVRAAGATVLAEPFDLEDADRLRAFALEAAGDLGGTDILVHNAGVVLPVPVGELSLAQWRSVMAVNATSHMVLTKAALPALRASPAPSVVTVASISAVHAFPSIPSYVASKMAAIGFVRALAVDLGGDGIRVNAILPGAVDTAMPRGFLAAVPEGERAALEPSFYARQIFKRFAAPDEIAAVALFLASDDASYMTGTAIPVDGGYAAW
jgi:NAD(P)-dependent dehydrogenase (short-subunit alcohol dehydrogenase family)